MIAYAKKNWENYTRECFLQKENETLVKFNPG